MCTLSVWLRIFSVVSQYCWYGFFKENPLWVDVLTGLHKHAVNKGKKENSNVSHGHLSYISICSSWWSVSAYFTTCCKCLLPSPRLQLALQIAYDWWLDFWWCLFLGFPGLVWPGLSSAHFENVLDTVTLCLKAWDPCAEW